MRHASISRPGRLQLTRHDRSVEREAHIWAIALDNNIDVEFDGTAARGIAFRSQRKIRVAPITTQLRYFIALHELGHILSRGNASMRVLESEADAWQWAFDNSDEEPTEATYRAIKLRLSRYLARSTRRSNMYVPGQGEDFYTMLKWLQDRT